MSRTRTSGFKGDPANERLNASRITDDGNDNGKDEVLCSSEEFKEKGKVLFCEQSTELDSPQTKFPFKLNSK
jgi:hypothetical protein